MGNSIIFEKETTLGPDKCLILGHEENFLRRLDFGDWSRLRMGGFFSVTAKDGPNSGDVSMQETLTLSGVADYVYLGLKNSDNQDFPLTPATSFWGFCSAATGVRGLNSASASPSNEIRVYTGGSVSNAAGRHNGTAGTFTAGPGWFFGSRNQMVATASFARWFGLEVEIIGANVAIRFATASVGQAITDVSPAALRTFMQEVAMGTAVTTASGGAAVATPPDGFFIRWPYKNSNLRIHCLGAFKMA